MILIISVVFNLCNAVYIYRGVDLLLKLITEPISPILNLAKSLQAEIHQLASNRFTVSLRMI